MRKSFADWENMSISFADFASVIFYLSFTQIEATELFFIISVILLTINYQKTVSDKLSLASYSMRKIWVIYSSVYFNYKRQFSTKIFLWVRMTISGSY